MLTQNSNGIDVEFDFVLLLSVCRQSVHADNGFAICKMACCMENMSTMKKKKLLQATAMLDPKESKFDKSSSSVVLPGTIAFFF